ncbi:hypothetical protein EYM_07825 [Ignicoccus islandicus DSM 13165]|uniref:Uncharacterized protein n=1 Tax=Ignicoccus islandicus DSM 13165 TaxID=940295 RepID=A0A0U3FSF0_9CREN|nr:hypothetical protein [Ignicoccus islandicus]ALU12823.1 hypothetical protein EYM_07825 [Ignicoccus islandicus DSM 13165]
MEKVDVRIVSDWKCDVYIPNRIPCLPSGMSSGKIDVISDKPVESYGGILYFSGKIVPKVDVLTWNPAIAVAVEYKNKILRSLREGEFFANVVSELIETKLPILIREGDETCLFTYYDALWYGYGHSLTSLILFSYYSSTSRTLLFIPRWFKARSLMEIFEQYCSSIIEVDGLGLSDNVFDFSNGRIVVGGRSQWLGSLEDTPDKFDPIKFYEQIEFLNALLK